mmetsp:Transcript_27529/g.84435  ORF Transcript_27529/g.84435 Transcript_27529/m.84435 type:complete len:112 (-) Transcript_27529:402-737(-)
MQTTLLARTARRHRRTWLCFPPDSDDDTTTSTCLDLKSFREVPSTKEGAFWSHLTCDRVTLRNMSSENWLQDSAVALRQVLRRKEDRHRQVPTITERGIPRLVPETRAAHR